MSVWRRGQPYSSTTEMPVFIPVWRPRSTLPALKWTVVPHSPYSSDLVPSNLDLFGPMKGDDTVRAAEVTSSHEGCYKCDMQALVHRWQKWVADGDNCIGKQCCSWEFALSNSVIVLFLSGVVSIEINRKRYFQSSLCMYTCVNVCKRITNAWKGGKFILVCHICKDNEEYI